MVTIQDYRHFVFALKGLTGFNESITEYKFDVAFREYIITPEDKQNIETWLVSAGYITTHYLTPGYWKVTHEGRQFRGDKTIPEIDFKIPRRKDDKNEGIFWVVAAGAFVLFLLYMMGINGLYVLLANVLVFSAFGRLWRRDERQALRDLIVEMVEERRLIKIYLMRHHHLETFANR